MKESAAAGLPPALTGEAVRVDETGLPILDQEVTLDPALEALAAQLRQELQLLAQEAFTATVKQVALDLKHSFEQRLEQALEERMEEILLQVLNKQDLNRDN